MLKKKLFWILSVTLLTFTACSNDDDTPVVNPDQPVVRNCAKPDYLKTGDKAAHEVIGANIVGNVYGGGNAAEVTGDTDVVIGKKKTE